MAAESSALMIVVATVVVILLFGEICVSLIKLQKRVQDWLFSDKGSVFAKVVVFFVWLFLSIFAAIFYLVSALCAVSLANSARKWWHKK